VRGALLAPLVFLVAAGGTLAVLALTPADEPAPAVAPLGWDADREDELVARAARGHAPVLYEKSPGGVRATARRVARRRAQVERAAAAAGVDPDMLEAMVFLESGGRPDARAARDLEGAAGLTQILAGTARDLLGMAVDTERSERLTAAIARAERAGRGPRADRLRALRRRVDERFDPAAALAGAGRYLTLARERFGDPRLAVVSYHMGMGNLETALDSYGDGGASWAQVYFDSTPTSHRRAYRFLYSLGDDSATYLWRVLAARAIMRRHRAGTLTARPPGRVAGGDEADLPDDAGLRCAGAAGECTLAAEAVPVARALGERVRELAGAGTALRVASASGSVLEIRRRYAGPRQAEAFQFVLDRMESLALIRWEREPRAIAVTALRSR
jgi:hypothetical protein